MSSDQRRYWIDVAERALQSTWQGALTGIPLVWGVADLHGVKAIGWNVAAGAMTGLWSFLKSVTIARKVGDPNTAATLSVEKDTPEPETPKPVDVPFRPSPRPHP